MDIPRQLGQKVLISPRRVDVYESSDLGNINPSSVRALRLRRQGSPVFNFCSYTDIRLLIVTSPRRGSWIHRTISRIDCPTMITLELGIFSFWGARVNVPALESLITLSDITHSLDLGQALAQPLPNLKSLTFKLHDNSYFRKSFPSFFQSCPAIASVRVWSASVLNRKDFEFLYEALFHPVNQHQNSDQEKPIQVLAPALRHFDLIIPAQTLLDGPNAQVHSVRLAMLVRHSRKDVQVGWHFHTANENALVAPKMAIFQAILARPPFNDSQSTFCSSIGGLHPDCVRHIVGKGLAFGPLRCVHN